MLCAAIVIGALRVKYKPNISDKSLIDISNVKSNRNIAKLRLGYNKLKEYQYKIGN